MVRAGRLTSSQLSEVAPGIFLGVRAARAFRRAKVDFKKHGDNLTIVGRYAAYRNAAVQHGMHIAGGPSGTRAEREKYNLNPNSQVSISDDPNGSHQDGRAFDFLINGSSAYPNAARRARFKKFGWFFQFGPNDPNHVRHDNIHGIIPVSRAWCIKHGLWVKPKK